MQPERKPSFQFRTDIEPDLWRELDRTCIRLDVTKRRVAEEGIKMWLDAHRNDQPATETA